MNWPVFGFLSAGIAAGSVQTALLWRAAQRALRPSVAGAPFRLAFVAGTLAAAAAAKQLLPAALGWGLGFAAGFGVVWMRKS